MAAAVAVLEKQQQHTLNGNRPFAAAKAKSPPLSIVPTREDLQEPNESRSGQTDDEKTETRKRPPTETAKNNSPAEDAAAGAQCEAGNAREHAAQQTKERRTDPHDDKFESAVKDFDLVARDVENIVANSLKRAGKTEGDGEVAVRDHVKAFSENDGFSDSSDYEASTTDSDSEREHVINEGLETITEEERNTNSSVLSFEGKRILGTGVFRFWKHVLRVVLTCVK